ncbi:sensor histidine kinase [Chthoniobacter flavus]|uniref:sensor histidine kinase n=1 Tax=Chthoniobacter flavus TaxID=191863 RepID=UPI0002EF8D88|nr:sensor histidine kinase [Chthoniobacter flavus]
MTKTAPPSAIPDREDSSSRFWQGVTEFFRKQSPGWLYFEAIVLMGIIGVLDFLTGYEVEFFPFYAIPILLAVVWGGRKGAVLIAGLSAMVWYAVDRAAGHGYSQEWLRIWQAIVRLFFFFLVVVAGIALKKQRDFSRAQLALSERLRAMEREIISVSEREQVRIGRDLHDGVCQYLVAIAYTAGLLKQDLEREASAKAATAGEIADLLQDAVVRTRDLARGLSPVDSDVDGLASALEALASRTTKLMGVSCFVIYPKSVSIPDNAQAIHLYRIAQEAVSNAVKHGHARSVIIALESTDHELALRISDDGIGFDPAKVEKRGMGLNTMRYRAHVKGGDLNIEPNSPTGTVVTCTIHKMNPGELRSDSYEL